MKVSTFAYSQPVASALFNEGMCTRSQRRKTTVEYTIAYLVMEYCDKDDLFTYVKSGQTRMNERLCHTLFLQVLCGINFMHSECNLAHLDVKLENVVIDSDFFLKMIDFAFCEEKTQQLWDAKGTEEYFAPEV